MTAKLINKKILTARQDMMQIMYKKYELMLVGERQ